MSPLLFVTVLTCCIAATSASLGQMPRRLEECLPIPTLAQELRQMRAETEASEPPKRRIIVQRLVFKGSPALAPSDKRLISASMMKRSFIDNQYEWTDELQERIRDQWQQRGYFKAVVRDPVVRTIAERPMEKRVAVTVQVNAGSRYRLGAIDFRNGTQFSPRELRQLVALRRGDVFDTHRIQKGLEDLRKRYGSRGFINLAGVPSFQIDEKRSLITLILDLDEGKQFRFGQIKILGLDPKLSETLLAESGMQPGRFLDFTLIDKFFLKNRRILPKDANVADDMQWVIDEQDGSVQVTLDFRGCPELADR
jgi:outer membrane protein assembly factor BamA